MWAPHVSTSIFSPLISHPTSLRAAEDEQGVACETKSTKLLRPLADRSTKKPRAPRHFRCLPEAIKQFHNGHHVWLWSRAHGTYLYADDDGSSVSLRLGRASVHEAWAVHNGGSIGSSVQ
uniref:Uncharacterized protein n=1 Tax=Oryza sativa subsp. japonica TaxID=39947 RepID=Q6K8T8_ORYSJ|nr:hypothetical protein [Oryza sativa Japonica Group]